MFWMNETDQFQTEFSTISMDKPPATSKCFPLYLGRLQLGYLYTSVLLNDTVVWQAEIDIEWMHWFHNEYGVWKI